MAIDDPTALPEDRTQGAEYLREADLAFDRQDMDRAMTLYWALSASEMFPNDDSRTHAYVRVGTILMGQDNDEEAYRWLQAAGPAGADMLKVLDAKTTDAPVDPDVIPATAEVVSRYVRAAQAANTNNDYATFDALVDRLMDSNATMPGERSAVCLMKAQSLLDRGHNKVAEEWAQHALAESSGYNADEARKIIAKAQAGLGPDDSADDRVMTYGFELTAAVEQFEGGMGDRGKAQFEKVLADNSGLNDDEAKGTAHYYLGMIAYHAHDFDVAREHFEVAAVTAGSPEIGYAGEALRWRYQEEG
jgi:tetratricopeptide (TPR) repeat protein